MNEQIDLVLPMQVLITGVILSSATLLIWEARRIRKKKIEDTENEYDELKN